LAEVVSEALSQGFLDLDIEADVADGRLVAYLAANGEVLSKQYSDSRVVVHCRLPARHLGRVRESARDIRTHQDVGPHATVIPLPPLSSNSPTIHRADELSA
jgi:GTP-binding protein HflX